MYRLENGVEWTEGLKTAFKQNVKRAKVICGNIEINEENNLSNLVIEEQRYISDYGFVGTATARKLELNFLDSAGNINLENQELTVKIGAEYNGQTYYINYGNFMVDKAPERDETSGKVRVVAYDYMKRFDKPYESSVTYPCTLLQVLQDICTQANVVLGTTDFANNDFIVEDNQFEGYTLRQVLQNIGKCAFSWARIGQDNKLYLDFSLVADNTETITTDDYYYNKFKKAMEYYGPVNQVTYADSDIEGQEEMVKDQASIDENGLKELVIYNNLFAYTVAKRIALIQAGTRLFGLRYMPIKQLDMKGLIYLDSRDVINIETLDGQIFTSRVFNHTIEYNGSTNDSIVTEGTSNNEEAYKNTATSVYQDMQMYIKMDKAAKTIESVVEEVNEQNNKISRVTQTVDELNSKISDISDITEAQETITGKLNFTDVNESEPITIRIRPMGVNISYLYPRTNLYPSSSLYMTDRRLRFTNLIDYILTEDSKYTNYKRYYSYDGTDYTLLVAGTDYTVGATISGTIYENKYVDYILPMDLLYYDADNYDEFLLDYDSETCQIRKKVTYNADGTTALLPAETTYTFEYPHTNLDDGNYEIELLGYSNAYLYVRVMKTNIYTSQFATKVEVTSEIDQKADEIQLGISQTLSNYSTTAQMNSAINLTANEINSTVSQKVGNDEVISKINQSSEAVTILANKLGLTANDVINIIAGNSINLTSKNISINSNNFSVDANGNMSCSNANITNGKVNVKGGRTVTDLIRVESTEHSEDYRKNFTYIQPVGAGFVGNGGRIDIGAKCEDFYDSGIDIFGNSLTEVYSTYVKTPQVIQTSLEEEKKNFEKYGSALNKLNDIDIYKYNLKFEKDIDKKHIGFVIGDKYKYLQELTNNDNNAVDIYSLASYTLQVCKEQQAIIENLQNEVNKLKEGK